MLSSKIIIKTPEQIEGIRAASKLAARTLNRVAEFISPGVTTQEINEAARLIMEQHHATAATLNYPSHSPQGKPYPAHTCISVNEVICHGVPGNRKLKEGDIVKVDVTPILNGYYGDTCRTFAVGKPTKKAAALMDCAEMCLKIGIDQVKPGNHIGQIGFHIGRYAKACGFTVVYQFCGHGVGVNFHEEPNVPHEVLFPTYGPVMVPGMIFTIEPMINAGLSGAVISEADGWTASTIDGKLSAQYEHTVLVTETGVEILTVDDDK